MPMISFLLIIGAHFLQKAYDQHYHPLYYMINTNLFRVFKEAPWILHFINIMLHALNAVFLFLFILLLTKKQVLSLMVSFFWVIHPIHALTVNCLIANSLMVYSIALLLSLFFLALYCEQNKKRYRVLSLFFFIISILNFEGSVLMPFYLFVLLYVHYKKSLKQTFKIIIPFGILIFIYLVLWIAIANTNAKLFEKMQYPDVHVLSSVLVYFQAIGWYLKNLFLPNDIVYIRNILPPANLFYVSLGVFLFMSSFLFLRKKSLLSFSFIWFYIRMFACYSRLICSLPKHGICHGAPLALLQFHGICFLYRFTIISTKNISLPI